MQPVRALARFRDSRAFPNHLDQKQGLIHIAEPVSTVHEITGIHRRVLARGGPALLFERAIRALILLGRDSLGLGACGSQKTCDGTASPRFRHQRCFRCSCRHEDFVTPRFLWAVLDKVTAGAAMVLLSATVLSSSVQGNASDDSIGNIDASSAASSWFNANETVASGYISAPYYYRSDLQLKRSNGTDLTLKKMAWDGDEFYFPVDGGARVIRWAGSTGVMIDFIHNKAISRLGKGAHGRKIKNGIVEDVETTGALKGQPAPSTLHMTDLFKRLEFTHGNNALLFSGLVRLSPLILKIRPYLGVGFGVAVPHVETWFVAEPPENRTNEYQYTGPAFQILAGLELRVGRGSYYVEYKFIWSSIKGALTGGRSWSLKDLKSDWLPRWFIEPFSGLTEMPGDLWRQFTRWRTGATPAQGTLETTLASHQIVIGGGYVWPTRGPAAVDPVGP